VAEIDAIVEPLRTALAERPVPRVHWRLVGRTDRTGWLAEHLDELLDRYESGSRVFRPGSAVPSRDNYVLLLRLLREDGVTAVVRQDSGTALVVVRELDGVLVIDRFSLPEVAGDHRPLLGALDEAAADAIVAALARPTIAWTPPVDVAKGTMVSMSRPGLERVDDLIRALSALGTTPPDLVATPSDPWIDRVTLYAPFGEDGLALQVIVELAEAGRMWGNTLADVPLAPDAAALATDAPELAPIGPGLVYAGTPTEQVAFHGWTRAAEVLARIEKMHPGSLSGHTLDLTLELPQASLGFGGALPAPEGLEAIRNLVDERPFRLTATFDDRREKVTVWLRPL
jgi:hypothetical protein